MNKWSALTLAAVMVSGCQSTGSVSGSRSLSSTLHGYSLTSEIVRAGDQSQRFEVRAGDCGAEPGWSDCTNDRERSEIRVLKRWTYGSNQWIGFSVYLPEDFKTSSKVNTTVGQIHQLGGPTGTAGGLKSYPPLMQMNLKGSTYSMCVHILSGSTTNVRDECNFLKIMDIADMRGTWTDLVINLDTSDDKQRMDVYANNKKVASISDWIKFRPRHYYLKYGIYRSFVSKHPGPMPTQILYIDEVKMGDTRESVRVNTQLPVD